MRRVVDGEYALTMAIDPFALVHLTHWALTLRHEKHDESLLLLQLTLQEYHVLQEAGQGLHLLGLHLQSQSALRYPSCISCYQRC